MNNDFHDCLARLVSGYWYTQTIYVAAKLGLAELLKDSPRTAQHLAEATGTNPKALYRLLRALASIRTFAEEPGRFVLTPLAECLLDPSTKAMAIMRGESQYRAWGELLYSVQTGRSAFEKLYGKPIFDYFSEHRETGKLFDQAMTGVHGRETEAMLDAYDFTGMGTLADIGGVTARSSPQFCAGRAPTSPRSVLSPRATPSGFDMAFPAATRRTSINEAAATEE
jgi:hypothetical protein